MRAPAVLCSPPIWWWLLRASCTVTTPVRPAAVEHCIGIVVCGRLRGCTSCVVRRIDCCIVVATKHTHHSRAHERRRGCSCNVAHRMRSIPHWRRASFPNAPMPRKPSCRMAYVAWVRVVFLRFASSPSVRSRAVSVRAACSFGARCSIAARLLLHVASPHVACSTLHFASLHDLSAHCMHVASVHRYIGNAQPSLWRNAV
jgi:hypothetical protein